MASTYEQKICKILNDAGVKYKREYTFKDLKSYRGKKLRYDFAVFNHMGQLEFLLEVHGVQHYRFVPHFHKNKKEWNQYRDRDLMKAHYALTRNIPFYVIPYSVINDINTFSDLQNIRYKITTKWYIYKSTEE